MTPILPAGVPPTFAPPLAAGANAARGEQPVFKELLIESLEHVNTMQQDADHAVEQFMTGGDVDPAEVLTAVQKADLTFRMMLQVRNKLVAAYQEINQIRI